jgi:hypothetical protein
VTSRKSKKGENPYGEIVSRDVRASEGKTAQDLVLNSAERQLYKYNLPELERGFGDLIDNHDSETIFPYAAITDTPAEEYGARMRRLVNLQPRVNKRKLNVPDHISVKLYKEVEEFPIQAIIQLSGKRTQKDSYDYVLIRRATLILTPLSSFVDSHSDVKVNLMDMRKRTGQEARSLTLQDNKQYKGEFTLDYCFPKVSASKISLSFCQEIPTFDTGEQWGACQIFLDLEESDYPQMSAFQDTIGMASLTTSVLEDYHHNPAHLNLAIRDSHRKKLQEMYSQGQIADETEPKRDRTKKLTYAKSSLAPRIAKESNRGGVTIDEEGIVDWSKIKAGVKPQIPDDQVSIDPEDDLSEVPDFAHLTREIVKSPRPLKSAMKVKSVGFSNLREPSEQGIHIGDSQERDDHDDGIPVGFDPAEDAEEENTGIPVKVGRLAQIRLPD